MREPNSFNTSGDQCLCQFAHDHTDSDDEVLVVNDQTGDLTLALLHRQLKVTAVSDSALGQRAMLLKLETVPETLDRVILVDSLNRPQGQFTCALFKVPKDQGLLLYQSSMIADALTEPAFLAAEPEDEPLPQESRRILEQFFTVSEALPGSAFGGLVFRKGPAQELKLIELPYRYRIPSLSMEIISHGGVFSGKALAPSTRLILTHFPKPPSPPKTIIDLGCGNGLLGLAAAKTFQDSVVFCVDESFLAVWSARETFRVNGHGTQGFFLTGDCLEDFDHAYADLILCNPPEGPADEATAEKMFHEARRVLKAQGEFWTVTETARNCGKVLETLFNQVRIAAYDKTRTLYKCLP